MAIGKRRKELMALRGFKRKNNVESDSLGLE